MLSRASRVRRLNGVFAIPALLPGRLWLRPLRGDDDGKKSGEDVLAGSPPDGGLLILNLDLDLLLALVSFQLIYFSARKNASFHDN